MFWLGLVSCKVKGVRWLVLLLVLYLSSVVGLGALESIDCFGCSSFYFGHVPVERVFFHRQG